MYNIHCNALDLLSKISIAYYAICSTGVYLLSISYLSTVSARKLQFTLLAIKKFKKTLQELQKLPKNWNKVGKVTCNYNNCCRYHPTFTTSSICFCLFVDRNSSL